MNEREVNQMTQVKESQREDLGLVWVDCPHYQEEEVLSIEKALLEANAHVYSGRKLPVGEAADFVVLCPSGEDVVSEVRHLRALASGTPVLVFCSSLDPHLAKESLRAEASGFLKDAARADGLCSLGGLKRRNPDL